MAEILVAAELQHRDGRLCHSGGGWRAREVWAGVSVQDRKPAKLYGRLVNDRALRVSRTRLSAAVRLAHHLLTHLHYTSAQPNRPTSVWPLPPQPTDIHRRSTGPAATFTSTKSSTDQVPGPIPRFSRGTRYGYSYCYYRGDLMCDS